MDLLLFGLGALAAPPHDPGYVVVLEERLAGSGYEKAAQRLAHERSGEVVLWKGDWGALEALLLERKPRWLALVLAPDSIDANLPRRLVPVLARFDADPFVDCAFGLITGASGEDAERFVERGAKAARADLPARKLEVTSVVLERCAQIGPRSEAAPGGRALDTTSLWITGQDPEWRAFVAQRRGLARGAGLVEWGHCGDPIGIWLFSMYRNMDRSKHWPYDPHRVGYDLGPEMPRLTAADLLDGVDLAPAVVINGACHSGVTSRAIVGGDIVSTFGDTGGKVRFHAIEPAQSFPLQAIAHGASAYIAPLAANNANRAALEEWAIRAGGTALGDVLRGVYDELVLGAERLPLAFHLFADGEDEPREVPMFTDSFHRVLFGAPAFVPWSQPVATTHAVRVQEQGKALRVDVRWREVAHDPWVWDPWREARGDGERGRIYERIPLRAAPAGEPRVKLLTAEALKGKELRALALDARALVEIDPDGRPVLHLKASGRREELCPPDPAQAPDELHAVFEVRFGG
jgi:hypothetical protein